MKLPPLGKWLIAKKKKKSASTRQHDDGFFQRKNDISYPGKSASDLIKHAYVPRGTGGNFQGVGTVNNNDAGIVCQDSLPKRTWAPRGCKQTLPPVLTVTGVVELSKNEAVFPTVREAAYVVRTGDERKVNRIRVNEFIQEAHNVSLSSCVNYTQEYINKLQDSNLREDVVKFCQAIAYEEIRHSNQNILDLNKLNDEELINEIQHALKHHEMRDLNMSSEGAGLTLGDWIY